MDTQSKNTYLHTPMRARTHKSKHTNTPPVEADGRMRWNDTASLVRHHSPLSSFLPSAHSLRSSPGRMEGWTFTDRTQVRRFYVPPGEKRGVKQKKRRGEWKERGFLSFLCKQFGLKLIIDACCTIVLFCIGQLNDKSTCVHVGYIISGCVCRQIDSVLSLAGLQPCAVSSN